MREITFVVPGEPVGKGRPRFVRQTGRAYTPQRTADYEKLVRQSYKQQVKLEPFEKGVPLSLHVDVYQQIPKSASKRKQEAMIGRKILPTKKPDCSNILKSIEDGLNGVAYADDSQIVRVSVAKFFSETPEAVVTIKRL